MSTLLGGNKKFINLFLVASTLVVSPLTFAQDDDLLADTESTLNSEQIDIDGSFSSRPSPADRIAKMRKKLEKQNEEMVQKKIEDMRIREEMRLANKLQKAFKGQAMNNDQISTTQAAPQRVVAPAPIPEVKKAAPRNKIIPFLGVQQYNGDNIDGYESTFNGGLAFETMLNDRVSIGLGVQYTTMGIEDESNQFNNLINCVGCFGFDTTGDKINYKRLNLNVQGKFFLTTDSIIRPYVGAGLGYNRTTLNYDTKSNNNTNTGFGGNFGNNNNNEDGDRVSASNVSGSGLIGGEVNFTDNIGMNLDFRYTRGLTSGFDKDEEELDFNNNTQFGNYDDQVLKNLGSAIEESDEVSLNIGLIIKF